MKLFIYILLTASLFSQDIIISDSQESHANFVASAVDSGYVGDVNTINVIGDFNSALSYAQTNNISIIVRSVDDLSQANRDSAANNYPNIISLFPAGSNSHEQSFTGAIPQPMIITGMGADSNETGYNIEFYDIDPHGQNASSYSNGFIAGRFLYLKDSLGYDNDSIRAVLRLTSTLAGSFTNEDGYGRIQLATALAYSGSIPSQDFIPRINTFTHVRGDDVVLTIDADYYDKLYLYKDDVIEDSTLTTTYTDVNPSKVNHITYKLIAKKTLTDNTTYYDTLTTAAKYHARSGILFK